MTPEEIAITGFPDCTAKQDELAAAIRAYGAQCRRAALEEASRVVCLGCSWELPYDPGTNYIWHTTRSGGRLCDAHTIRRLMEQEVRDE